MRMGEWKFKQRRERDGQSAKDRLKNHNTPILENRIPFPEIVKIN